jgi:hypothetical protein
LPVKQNQYYKKVTRTSKKFNYDLTINQMLMLVVWVAEGELRKAQKHAKEFAVIVVSHYGP